MRALVALIPGRCMLRDPSAIGSTKESGMAHPFETDSEILVEAPPEAVWKAITTGPGVDAWFMGRNEVTPRVGGAVRTVATAFTLESTVTAWEPPTRFAHQSPEGEDGSIHAFEYVIDDRGKGRTGVRWIHSGLLGTDWEAQYEALKEGDPGMLFKLRQYLTYFRGRTATPITAWGPQVSGGIRGWRVFEAPLGLSGAEVAIDGPIKLTPEGLDPIEGVVDQLTETVLGVRSADALYRFAHTFRDAVFVGHHIYAGVGEQAQSVWQAWLLRAFS
jgi:uncharacterized protein YndB with AHSA1/START domain